MDPAARPALPARHAPGHNLAMNADHPSGRTSRSSKGDTRSIQPCNVGRIENHLVETLRRGLRNLTASPHDLYRRLGSLPPCAVHERARVVLDQDDARGAAWATSEAGMPKVPAEVQAGLAVGSSPAQLNKVSHAVGRRARARHRHVEQARAPLSAGDADGPAPARLPAGAWWTRTSAAGTVAVAAGDPR